MNYTKAKKALIKDGISAQELRSEINRRQCCQLATMIILKQILAIKIVAIVNLLRFRIWYDNLMVATNIYLNLIQELATLIRYLSLANDSSTIIASKSMLSIVFVRNPLERVASAYYNKLVKECFCSVLPT